MSFWEFIKRALLLFIALPYKSGGPERAATLVDFSVTFLGSPIGS
jgi:hypothetical protein